MALKRLVQQIVFILILSSIIGLGANFSLIKKYIQGEFRHTFLSSEEYPSIAFITFEEAEELFSKGEALFIDSRPEEAFQEGHILGATNIPFEEQKEGDILNLFSLALEGTLVVYCDGSECRSSVELAKLLHEKGFKDIKVFFGGWIEWKKEGLPVSSENVWQ